MIGDRAVGLCARSTHRGSGEMVLAEVVATTMEVPPSREVSDCSSIGVSICLPSL